MDSHPPMSTIFLHEDTLARTLAYEQGLQAWRCAELSAGRPDPGRTAYGVVSSCLDSPGNISHQCFRYSVWKI